jgi:polyisoprenoid-binding protein YceI
LRGVTRPVIFDLQLHGFGEGFNGESKVAFSAETTIRRDDFGIVFDATLPNGRLVVGNDVRISLEIEAVRR